MAQQLRGKKYSGDFVARQWGSSDAFLPLANMTEFSTSKDIDKDELKSTGKDDYGEALEVDNIPSATEAVLKSNTYDKYMMARVLMGTAVDLSTTPVTFADKSLVVGMGLIKLEYDDIDVDTLVLTNSNGDLIDPGTYDVKSKIGMLEFKDNSTLTVGETINYSGSTLGSAGYQIDANTIQRIELEVYIDGKDRITGKEGVLWVPHLVLASDGDINWFTDEYWESGLAGTVIKDKDKPPMRFKEYANKD